MAAQHEPLWTIDELGQRVALALSVNYDGQSNGSVRDVPDRRTIRYYTTLGLIDRPTAMRGRSALYGRRHLLQLVAIKRLQARGLSLAELQEQLLGLTDRQLAQIAELPAEVEAPSLSESTAEPVPQRLAFWKEVPAPPDPVSPAAVTEETAPAPLLQTIPLTEAAALQLAPLRRLYPDDLEAIHAAAAPLLKLLEKRRLLRPRHERRSP